MAYPPLEPPATTHSCPSAAWALLAEKSSAHCFLRANAPSSGWSQPCTVLILDSTLPADSAPREGLAAPPRRPRSRKVSCPLTRSNGDLVGGMVRRFLSGRGRPCRQLWAAHSPDPLVPCSADPSAPPLWDLLPPASPMIGLASPLRWRMVCRDNSP